MMVQPDELDRSKKPTLVQPDEGSKRGLVGLLLPAGQLELGLAKRSVEEREKGLGRHGSTIRLGRSLWQRPRLDGVEAANIK